MSLGENPSVLDVALEYGALGFRVVPVDKISKRPLLGLDWGHKASSDRETISSWWQRWPSANVGICPDDDWCVLDVDVKNDGFEALVKMEAEHGAIPRLVEGHTGGGGLHLYFRCDPTRELHRKPAGKNAGMEILKKGYQGIEYPSMHESGRQYVWKTDIRLMEKAFWPMAPEWFYKPVSERQEPPKSEESIFGQRKERPYYNGSTSRFEAYCMAALANQRQELANCPDGDRNNSLNIAALKLGHLAHYGFFDKAKAFQELRFSCDLNGLIKDHGVKAFEATFESGWNKGITEPYHIKDREDYQEKPTYGPNVDPETGEWSEPEYRFKLIPFMEAKPTLTSRYLVKGLIPSQGFVIIWGPPKCGKSFWAADVCAHVAAGLPYRGKRVRKGNVVYVAAEGAQGFLGRLQAWRDAHPGSHDQSKFWTVPQRLNLVEEFRLLIEDIKLQVGDNVVDLVALDTLNRTFTGSESSDEDMTAYITASDAIKAEFGCSVIVIHHCGVDGTRPRGHTSLTGAADTQIAITRGLESGVVTSKLEWMKDGEEGFETHSKLEVVELGNDEDGDPVTTCVVVPTDQADAPYRGRKEVPAGSQSVLLSIHQAIGEVGEPHNSSRIPAGERVIKTELWRKYFYARSTDDTPEAKKKAFKRGTEWLATNGYVGIWEGLAWIINHE